jgi:cytosolic carboxypeptidase protein 2/3
MLCNFIKAIEEI